MKHCFKPTQDENCSQESGTVTSTLVVEGTPLAGIDPCVHCEIDQAECGYGIHESSIPVDSNEVNETENLWTETDSYNNYYPMCEANDSLSHPMGEANDSLSLIDFEIRSSS